VLWGVSFVATISPLKKSLYAAEQQRADVARARRRWIREQGLLDPARLVFIDETATSTNMVRLRGRCPRGVRLVGYAPHGHWKTITFVAGLRHDRMVAPFVMEGAMNGLTFVEWVRQFLAPTLKRRDVVSKWNSRPAGLRPNRGSIPSAMSRQGMFAQACAAQWSLNVLCHSLLGHLVGGLYHELLGGGIGSAALVLFDGSSEPSRLCFQRNGLGKRGRSSWS
jgi:hypothetical protein